MGTGGLAVVETNLNATGRGWADVGAAMELHLRWCAARGLRPRTIDARHDAILRVQRTTGPLVTASPHDLGLWWLAFDVTAGARATELAHVRQFCLWLVREGYRADDPTSRLVSPKVRAGQPRPISEPALAHALDHASDRVRPFLLLAAYCGLRAGEIARLRGESRHGENLLIDGKGGKERVVPIHPKVDLAIRWRPGWLFRYDRWPSRPLEPYYVSQLANAELHAMGISETLHQLRHRFATRVYQQSLDLRLTQELMGHANPMTTARYAAWERGSALRIIAAI